MPPTPPVRGPSTLQPFKADSTHEILKGLNNFTLALYWNLTRGSTGGCRVPPGVLPRDRPQRDCRASASSTTWTPEGVANIFLAVDHCTIECIGIHAARPGTRFEALEPIRQGLREHYPADAAAAGTAGGLTFRHDHGSQYMSDYFQGRAALARHRKQPRLRPAARGHSPRRLLRVTCVLA